jgi:hypothetical protein
LIPFNIKNFEETVVPPGTVDIIQYKMDHFAGIKTIQKHILEYPISIREPSFQAYHFALMMDSLAGRPNTEGPYDYRYFFERDGLIVPVSGLVRKLEANYLARNKSAQFHSELTPVWVNTGLQCSNKSVQGFAFEQYCLSMIYRHPSFLIKNLVSPCSIVYFDDRSKLVLGESDCTLFWPKNYWYPKVDAVLRYANPKSTKIIAIQVTLQDPSEHQQTLEFFQASYSKNASRFAREGEVVEYSLAWILHKKEHGRRLQNPKRKAGDIGFNQFVKYVINGSFS